MANQNHPSGLSVHIMKPKILCLLLALGSLHTPTTGQDPEQNWLQWRGPLTNGVSPTANPPTTWSEDENVQWKVAIEGQGTSTPIICDNRIFLLTAIETGKKDTSIPDPEDQPKTNFFNIKRPNIEHAFVVLCLDRQTGKEIWRQTATKKIPHEGTHQDNDFASASPTTDGERLICWFGSAGLVCYDLDGNRLWDRDLGEAQVGSSLGEGCSPVLHENRVIILRDHAKLSRIEVLDADTGETVWQKERGEDNAWATPIVVEAAGKTQVITAASAMVRSYDLDTGDVIWECGGLTGNVTPCPVLYDNHVICMSGYQGYAAMAIPLDQTGDLTGSTKIRWKRERGTPYIPSPVLIDDQLYYTQSNQSILTCVDAASGEVHYGPVRLNGISNIYASLVGAQNRVYILGRGGTTLVINKGKEYDLLATNRLDDRFDASPAMVGNQLFLRGAKFLYCLAEQDNAGK